MEPGIYCADMTQLIGASSFLHKPSRRRYKAIDSRSQLYLDPTSNDPMASSSFEIIATVIANDTAVFFNKPDFLRYQSPLIKGWESASNDDFVRITVESRSRGRSSPAKSQTMGLSWENEEIRNGFKTYVAGTDYPWLGTNAQLLAQWVKFQTSNTDLMVQFWRNNSRDDMERCRDIVREFPSHVAPLRSTVESHGIQIDRVSLRTPLARWTAVEFAMTYAYWAFAKGFRYAKDLPQDSIYVSHWLREKVALFGLQIDSNEALENYQRLFPWGVLLKDLARRSGGNFGDDELFEALVCLRRFTSIELPRLRPSAEQWGEPSLYQGTAQFVLDAVASCMPKPWKQYIDKESLPKMLKKLLVALIRLKSWGVALAVDLVEMEQIKHWLKETDIAESVSYELGDLERRLQMYRYRTTVDSVVAANQEGIDRFFEARGWTKR